MDPADIVVVGEAGYDAATVAQVNSRTPDVVILDAATIFPDAGAAGTRLRELAPSANVIVLTLHNDPATRQRALAAGARDVVCKHNPDGFLLAAIRAAAAQRPQTGSDL